MEADLESSRVSFSRLSIVLLFNPAGENDVIETVHLEDQAAHVVGE